MLDELLDGGHVRQVVRITQQMQQRDECVRLATTIGHLKLSDGLVVVARQPLDHILGQFAQVVGRVGQGEELGGFLIDLPRLVHHHVVQIRREDGERKLTRLEIVSYLYDLMPRRPLKFSLTHNRVSSANQPASICRNRKNDGSVHR